MEVSLYYDASVSSGSESETEGRDDAGWDLGTTAEGDLEGYAVTLQDARLQEVYAAYVHKNPGSHLHGAVPVEEDEQWQQWWTTMVGAPKRQYKLPSGTAGNKLLYLLVDEWKGVREGKWNSERPLVFVMVVLQQAEGVTGR